MTTQIIFNSTEFRSLFPAFGNQTLYPDATLNNDFTLATGYVSDRAGGCFIGGMSAARQKQALYLMTAHLLAIGDAIATGSNPALLQAATIDKISVTQTPPPVKNQWQWWLSTTAYGQQLLALLQVASVGGFYVPGAPPARAGFRF